MKIERNSNNRFNSDFSSFSCYGFHAASSLAASEIQKVGILPNKIFDSSDHQLILCVASNLKIDVSHYHDWLKMRSITFTKRFEFALAHIEHRRSGGQGLGTMEEVLDKIELNGDISEIKMAQHFKNEINNIRTASSVIYAVDLSDLGSRLTNNTDLYQVYFDPSAPLPKVSIVTPNHLIARLDVI